MITTGGLQLDDSLFSTKAKREPNDYTLIQSLPCQEPSFMMGASPDAKIGKPGFAPRNLSSI